MTNSATTAADQTATPVKPEVLCDRVLTTFGAGVTARSQSQRVRTKVCIPAASRTVTHRARARYLVGVNRPL